MDVAEAKKKNPELDGLILWPFRLRTQLFNKCTVFRAVHSIPTNEGEEVRVIGESKWEG